jgi:NAD(P)-dependent dehydrogenase (short-subunit alcohol dehydrogenase family)
MSQRLSGRSAVVTGGGGGLGEATAIKMAEEGAAVAILDIDGALAERTAATIVAAGGKAVGIACDVSDPGQVRKAFDVATEAHGIPTALFNNAGISGPLKQVPDIAIEEFDQCIAVNLRGVFLVAAAFLRGARDAQLSAAMVSTSSIDAVFTEPESAVYSATKGAVISMTRTMALDHARQGIRVNCICPGHVLSPMTKPFYDASPGALEQAEQMHALGRIGRPEEIADAVVFLCSEQSSFITGTAMIIDGGMSLGAQIVPNYDLTTAS